MRAPTHTLHLGGLLALSVALLLGCGGGGDSTATEAELALGAALLPSDGQVTAADVLSAAEMPPDGSTTAVVDDEDMPPST